jgi:CheY-like chemotaxis protein
MPDNQPTCILVVDDDPIARMMHCKILQRAGHQVIAAENGAQAVACVKQQCFNVICMDIDMPGINGLEATAQIRAQESTQQLTHIIGITSHSQDEREACLAKGMNAVLTKPISPEQLVQLVQQLCG